MMRGGEILSSDGTMRIGIYGGTFDPIHLGHLVLAEQCREQLELDEVWFVPAGDPPHKRPAPLASGRQRRDMVDFAISGHAHFLVSDIELERDGPSYTIETLTQLNQLHPGQEWWLLIGADSLKDFPTWKQPEDIVQLARVAAVNRGDARPADAAEFTARFGERLDVVTMPGISISASDIRQRVAEGRSIRFLVPRAVEVYIQQQGLYRSAHQAAHT
jgi:nicotinate-nucleotide adenylyltransferase